MSKVQLIKNSASGIMPVHIARVIVFEKEGGSFLIDQQVQQVQTEYIYLVPPLHCYHIDIEHTGNMMAIDIPYPEMTPDCRQALNYVAYQSGKGFSLGEDTGYYDLLVARHKIQSVYIFEEALLSRLSKSIKKSIEAIPELNAFYLEVTERFFDLLATSQAPAALDVTAVSVALNTHKQTLQRAFAHILNTSVKKAIDQFVVSQSLHMLLEVKAGKSINISTVAAAMNFATESDFSRFFKNKTGLSPVAFRKEYL